MTIEQHCEKYLANQQDRSKAEKDMLADLLHDTFDLAIKRKAGTNKKMVRVFRRIHKKYLKIIKQLIDSGIYLDEGLYVQYLRGFYPDAWELYADRYCYD